MGEWGEDVLGVLGIGEGWVGLWCVVVCVGVRLLCVCLLVSVY